MTRITRRAFLARSSVFALGLAMPRGRRAPPALRIGILPGGGDRLNGATLGIEEARHAAAMFGGGAELVPIASLDTLAAEHVAALIGDDDSARCMDASARTRALGLVFMNVSCTTDIMRGGGCGPTTFNVVPSSRMYRDAVALAGGGEARAWDPSLARFGADTLNNRFRSRFQRDMSSDAWTSWVAVKILWEASLRAKSVEPAALAAYMARETTQFDGHKGRPLSFRAWDHQLRQPVYVRRGSELIEQPAPAGNDEPSREALDRIGVPRDSSFCRMER